MGPLSRLVDRPPFESWLSKDVLPLTIAANGPNDAISLTQTFNRILFNFCNGQYFLVQNEKNRDRGTFVHTVTLRIKPSLSEYCIDFQSPSKLCTLIPRELQLLLMVELCFLTANCHLHYKPNCRRVSPGDAALGHALRRQYRGRLEITRAAEENYGSDRGRVRGVWPHRIEGQD